MMLTMDPSRQLIGWFIRHGELKNMRIWDGWSGMDLSEEGKEQAAKAAQWLSYNHIGRIVSSDVPRTMRTAQYLMDMGTVECPFMACDSNLRPWNVSDEFTGKEKTPERIAAFEKYIKDPDLVIPGGESRNQLHDRVQVIWQYFMAPYKALPTAAFIHNSVIKSLMGMDDIKDAVSPGGIIGVYMDEKGDVSFQVLLGEVNAAEGVS